MLVQPSKKYASDWVFAYLTDTAKLFSPVFDQFLKNQAKYWGDTLFRVVMGGTNALTYKEKDGFHIEPLLVSDKNLSWNRIQPISNDSLQLKVTSLPDDERGSLLLQCA